MTTTALLDAPRRRETTRDDARRTRTRRGGEDARDEAKRVETSASRRSVVSSHHLVITLRLRFIAHHRLRASARASASIVRSWV